MTSFLKAAEIYGVHRPNKLLHIGANYGQEAENYEALGIQGWHVEAIPSVFSEMAARISKYPNQHPICACLSSREGEHVKFNVASNRGQSSSILNLGRHGHAYPSVEYIEQISLTTKTIDGLVAGDEVPKDVEFIVIDAQGAEKMILEGSTELLKSSSLKGILVETAVEPLYEGGATYLEIGMLLRDFGFYLCQATFNKLGWTDALYARAYWPLPPKEVVVTGKNIAPLATVSQSSSYGDFAAASAFSGARSGGFAFHTDIEDRPWIKLTFPEVAVFDEIVVFNRMDAGRDRSRTLEILTSADGENWVLLHKNSEIFGGIDGNPLRVTCPATSARHVLCRLAETNYLHLDQVEIYAVKPDGFLWS